MSAAGAGGRRTLNALAGIRIFVALNLVFYHFAGKLSERTAETLPASVPERWRGVATIVGTFLSNLFHCGFLGTCFFFVLSGFVLGYRYLGELERGTFSLRSFWINRLTRIYPLYLLAMGVMAVPITVELYRAHSLPVFLMKLGFHAAAAASLLHAWTPITSSRWNFPTWSLSAEIFFYALFPFVGAWIVRAKHSRRGLLGWMAVCWVVSLLPGLFYWVKDPDGVGRALMFDNGLALETAVWMKVLKFTPLFRGAEFILGVLLSRLYLDDLERGLQRRGDAAVLAVLVLIGALVLNSHRLPYPLVHNGFAAPLFALLVYGLAHGAWLGRWLETKLLVRWGEASFAVFVLHVPVGELLLRLLHRLPNALRHHVLSSYGRGQTWAFMLLYVAIMLAFAWALTRYVEPPARGWMKARLSTLWRPRKVPLPGVAAPA